MGLLDFLNSAEAQTGLGLLAAAGPRSDGAGFGQRMLEGLSQGDRWKAQQAAAKRAEMQDQMMQMQMAQAQAQMADQQKMRGLAQQFAKPAIGMAADGYGPSQPASFDREGYGAALEGIDPIAGRNYLQGLQKDNSPLTVSEGQTLLDRNTLRPIYSNVKPKEIDPNKPFMVIDGKVIPNPDYQSYELKKAAQGATRLNVHTNMGTQETEQSKAYGKNLGEVRSEIQKSGFVAPSVLAKLGRMEELLQNVDGGKLAPLGRDVASMAKSFGVNIDPNLGNKEAAQSLAVEMALSMKQPGSGPTTDKDFDNFMSTVPDLSKTAAGRSQIISTMRAKANRDLTIAKTARDYAAKNKGVIDDGFLDIAAQIVADNPVIQVQKPAATSGGWSITPVGR